MASSVFNKYPSSLQVDPIVSPPSVSLASASDSGTKGDQITNIKNVQFVVSNNKVGVISWMSGDTNATLDAADTPVVNGVVNATLAPGYNTFRFYSMDIATGTVSTAAYLPVYMDPAAAVQQDNKFNETLNKVALGYLGRPLSDTEYTLYRSILESGNGDATSLVRVLSASPEFFAVYTVPDLNSGIDRCFTTLFGRSATAQDKSYWSSLVLQGQLAAADLPYRIANEASGSDLSVLSARVVFMEQANVKFAENLKSAGISERTLMEVERAAVQGVNSLADVSKVYESLVVNAKNLATDPAGLPSPVVSLDSASDTGTKGDFQTTLSSVKINVSGTTPGSLTWLDLNANGKFDAASDSVAVNGAVYAALKEGANALTFYQTINNKISNASYLTLWSGDASTPTSPPTAPVLDLRTADDDGADNTDNVTTKSLVRIDVSGLDPKASFAWLEKDGNGIYDAGKDVALTTGSSTATATVQLATGDEGSSITGFSAYQMRSGARSNEGALSITYLKSVSTLSITSGSTIVGTDGLVTVKFDRPVDWARLDANGDGKLQMGVPGTGAELGVSLAGGQQIIIDNNPSDWVANVPVYGGLWLTITNVDMHMGINTTLVPPAPYESGSLVIVLTGVPDVSSGVTSSASYTFSVGG